MSSDRETPFPLVIYFRPPRDGNHHYPRKAYLVRGGKTVSRICRVYIDRKTGEERGLDDALEGRFSVVDTEYLQPYSDELWEACKIYEAERERILQELSNWRERLRSGEAFRQMNLL